MNDEQELVEVERNPRRIINRAIKRRNTFSKTPKEQEVLSDSERAKRNKKTREAKKARRANRK